MPRRFRKPPPRRRTAWRASTIKCSRCKRTIKNPVSGFVVLIKGVVALSGLEWRVMCSACLALKPEPAMQIHLNDIRQAGQALAITVELVQYSWFRQTNWKQLIYEIFDYMPEVPPELFKGSR